MLHLFSPNNAEGLICPRLKKNFWGKSTNSFTSKQLLCANMCYIHTILKASLCLDNFTKQKFYDRMTPYANYIIQHTAYKSLRTNEHLHSCFSQAAQLLMHLQDDLLRFGASAGI